MEQTAQSNSATIISPEQLLEHWQGHRRLTRRVIEAFPEKAFFTHTIGGMRPFAEMVMELLAVAEPGLKALVFGEEEAFNENRDPENSKEAILNLWDEATEKINVLWPKLLLGRFQEDITLFGQYQGTGLSHILYFIDNEIHHRGQGYVYLRSLGVEPPFFWER